MTKKPIKSDIEFELDGVEYSLTPMKQRVAAHVFHNCLSHVLAAVAQAFSGDTEADKIAKFAAALPKAAQFDNGVEIDDLDKSGVFDEHPHHMYLVVYHAVKGNWPGYFSKMEAKMGGFVSKLKRSFQTVEETVQ